MEIYFKKTSYGLIPLYDSDKEAYDKIHIGDEIKAEISKPRNYEFHKKVFSLLNKAYESQEQITDFNDFREYVTCKAGFYNRYVTDKGVFYVAKSISYASMDDLEFNEYFNKLVDVIIKEIGVDREELINEVLTYL